MLLYILLSYVALATGKTDDSYKDQFCTDPRTMRKHAAYSEWADAYSCSRHRCQPGGRNLAIYTVGCKRVEAPESAIECEEVVEDTNMQFPYCCVRLRCLVVVRGEVWTRVLGQPWETLPAAPWSHMYKMKKPPPSDETFLPKHTEQGPVYELQTDATEEHEKTMRASSSKDRKKPDVKPSSQLAPDIVIALTTSNDEKNAKKATPRHKEIKPKAVETPADEFNFKEREAEVEEGLTNEKIVEISEEKISSNSGTPKTLPKAQNTWSQIPQNQWSEREPTNDVGTTTTIEEKPEASGLQALVDAIGTRMRDIEDVVQRMSEKVVQKAPEHDDSEEKRRKNTGTDTFLEKEKKKTKKANTDAEYYKRFTAKNHGSKYLRASVDLTTEQPLFIEDTSGYFSDASNSVVRRTNLAKEPVLTYMAPVENHRKPHMPEDTVEKKHKKRNHKKKKTKGKGHKKHHGKEGREDKKKRFNKLSSVELDKNVVSFEDSSAHV